MSVSKVKAVVDSVVTVEDADWIAERSPGVSIRLGEMHTENTFLKRPTAYGNTSSAPDFPMGSSESD
ncbi:UNVERIFIED_CONTAM: hypothetical protein PYX00_005760 [Menopon gallinae]|uniref:Uncharacterized protein n=1 Tax=Menopon gallinae TaxID=328185 RepID=A0AAW2HUK1_9NEOP